MSLAYLLDTDAVVDILRRRHRVAERVAGGLTGGYQRVMPMTVAELLYGSLCSQDPERSDAKSAGSSRSFASFRSERAAAAAHSRHSL